MTAFEDYKEKVYKMKRLVEELEKTSSEIFNIAGGNVDCEERELLCIAANSFRNFLFVQESIVENEDLANKFEILKENSFHYLDKEGTIRHKLFGVNSILNPITDYTLAASTYMYETGMFNDEKDRKLMETIRDEIVNLENHAHNVQNKIEIEINKRDPYYVSDEELANYEKSKNLY